MRALLHRKRNGPDLIDRSTKYRQHLSLSTKILREEPTSHPAPRQCGEREGGVGGEKQTSGGGLCEPPDVMPRATHRWTRLAAAKFPTIMTFSDPRRVPMRLNRGC